MQPFLKSLSTRRLHSLKNQGWLQKKVPVKKVNPQKKAPTQKVAQKAQPPKEPVKVEKKVETKEPPLVDQVLPKALAGVASQLDLSLEPTDEISDSQNPYRNHFQSVLDSHFNLKAGVEVQLAITLSQEGKILEVKHKKSNDPFYKDFILANIKQIHFSRFFGEIAREPEYTFNITLTGPDS